MSTKSLINCYLKNKQIINDPTIPPIISITFHLFTNLPSLAGQMMDGNSETINNEL